MIKKAKTGIYTWHPYLLANLLPQYDFIIRKQGIYIKKIRLDFGREDLISF